MRTDLLTPPELSAWTSLIAKTEGDEAVFEHMLNLLATRVPFQGATYYMTSSSDDTPFVNYFQRGEETVELFRSSSLSDSDYIVRWMLHKKEPIVLSGLKDYADRQPVFRSLLFLPICLEDQIQGVLALGDYAAETYAKQDKEFYQLLALQLSLGLQFHTKFTAKSPVTGTPADLTNAVMPTEEKITNFEESFVREIQPFVDEILNYCRLLPLMIETRNRRKLKQGANKIQTAAVEIDRLINSNL